MQLSGCTRSSNEGSKHRPCCRLQILPLCCSGRCLHQARSTCTKSMAGRRSPQSPSISQLTSQPETIPSYDRRSRRANSNHIAGGTPGDSGSGSALAVGIMIDVPTPGRLVRRDVVHVQDLLNNIVNLAEHENAHLFLPLGRREQNDSRYHGANVRENVAEFVWARHKFDHNASYLGAKTRFVCVVLPKLRRIAVASA